MTPPNMTALRWEMPIWHIPQMGDAHVAHAHMGNAHVAHAHMGDAQMAHLKAPDGPCGTFEGPR